MVFGDASYEFARTAKKAAPGGEDKKKRKRTRKETYSSYIYKGKPL